MKKILLITGTALVVLLMASSYVNLDFTKDSEGGIQFHRGSWDEVLDRARKEKKLIFVDVYATWCGPCKLLKAHTFSDESVGEFYNRNFINVTLDGEKGEGPNFIKRYELKGYPSLLFIDPSEKLIKKASGYHKPNQLISLGEEVLAK